MRRSTILFWVGLVVALLAVGYLGGRQQSDGPPLDPNSTGPLGTRALTELVEAFGGSVTEGNPTAETDVVLVLLDRLSDADRRELERWARDGGLVVVADPSSSLSPPLSDFVTEEALAREVCTIPEMAGVNVLEADSFVRYPIGSRFSCFGGSNVAYVVAEPFGNGRIVSLGGAVALTNQNLDRADNAVLAVNLLAGEGTSLTIVYDPGAVASERTLSDLIPTPVRWLGWQLVLAFALYVFWRARRFGGVVAEPQLVDMPGSLLVRATGELSRRAGSHQAAGMRLRHDLDRRLRAHYRLPPDLELGVLVTTVAQRSAVDPALLAGALGGPPPLTGTDLASLVADIDAVSGVCLQPSVDPRPVVSLEHEDNHAQDLSIDQPLVGSSRD